MSEPASKEDVRQIIKDELRPLWKRVEALDREVRGHNGTPGVTERLGLVYQHVNRWTWHARALWVAMLSGAGAVMARAFW